MAAAAPLSLTHTQAACHTPGRSTSPAPTHVGPKPVLPLASTFLSGRATGLPSTKALPPLSLLTLAALPPKASLATGTSLVSEGAVGRHYPVLEETYLSSRD